MTSDSIPARTGIEQTLRPQESAIIVILIGRLILLHTAIKRSFMLVIFGGLPGTGKSTLAMRLAHQIGAVYLRIDTIERAMAAGVEALSVGERGDRVAYAVAEDNLRFGHTVIADSVNPLQITRSAWRDVAARLEVDWVEIEVVCSDPVE